MPQLNHKLGESIELRTDANHQHPRWRYLYGDGKSKPYFHPVCTPQTGIPLTIFEPYDHVWHRGLWFTIKFVNGENFWEEHAPYGTQESSLPQVTTSPDGQLTMTSDLIWRHSDGQIAIHESRIISYVPLTEDSYALDWEVTLVPTETTLLDRTPFTTWGGYSGLTLRGTREWRDTKFIVPNEAEEDSVRRGQRAPWCEMSGRLDGGLDLSAGVAFFEHPANLRYPTPYYCHGGEAPKGGPFLCAALLFHEPLTLQANEALTLKYRVLVHEGVWTKEQLQAAYETYVDAHT